MTDAMAHSTVSLKIFSEVKYFVTGILPDNIKNILSDGGAEKINFFSDMVTHCIVGHQPRENDISDAKDLYEVPAVSMYWVLLSSYCKKALPTCGFLHDRTRIFSNTVITASQVTNADFKALWAMVTFYGGKFQSSLDKTCTHLISGKAIGKKYDAALSQMNIKIVTPDWIGECIKVGSRINEDIFHPKYLLFPKNRNNSPASSTDLSTAQILGFADDITPSMSSTDAQTSVSSTQALLEKLKQRMPWNRPPSTVSSTTSSTTTTQIPFSFQSQSQSYSALPQNKVITSAQSNLPQATVQEYGIVSGTSNNNQTIQSIQPHQQVDRIALEQSGRIIQQGPVWRSSTIQSVRPQYTLIQRDGSVVQTQTGTWTQYQLQQQQQQQRVQQQNAQQSQHTQAQSVPNQQNSLPQPQQMQQASLIQSTQVTGQPQQSGTINSTRQITWTQQPQLQGPPKQVIQLDPQTHAQLSQMDPHQRTLFLQKIQRQRQIILQQRQLQIQQQQRPVAQGGKLVSQQSAHSAQQQTNSQQQAPQPQQQQQPSPIPIRQQQIIIRGVMPPGLTPQQQAVWLHQQQFIRQQQILVQQQTGQIRHPANVSQSRVIQQQTATSTWIPQADQQQQQQQMQIQRQQQMRIQQLQIQKQQQQQQQIVVQRPAPSVSQQVFQQGSNQQSLSAPNLPQAIHGDDGSTLHGQVGGSTGGGLLVNNRTKTALANMLSSRLQTGHLSPQTQAHGQADGSAAGQLRMMSAQQRTPQPPPPATPASAQIVDAQSGPYGQQTRRALGTVDGPGAVPRPSTGTRDGLPPPPPPPPQATPVPVPKSPVRSGLGPCPPTPAGVTMSQKPQFFAHNPTLRIPPDKYFLGCSFYIVEYDRSEDNNLSAWEEIIREHGGEVESVYTHRVTHILCETQKHGIVQQALRDGKRCITAFWLNDVVLKGSLSVPWQALHFPVPFGKEKPLTKYQMTLTGFEDKSERERVATMIRVAGGQYRNYLSPLTHIVVCRKAEGAKYKKAKDTNKVTVNVQWLNEILFGHYSCIQQPEIHKYQQYNSSSCLRVDYSLIPHLMGAWKLPINVTTEAYNAIKNIPPPLRRSKRPKMEPEQRKELEAKMLDSVQITNADNISLENRPHIVVTGDKNFEITKKGKEMGCVLARADSTVTHLVVCGKPMRTLKMLKCLIVAKHIVKDSWLIDSHSANKLLNESDYAIHQVDSDDFKCNISKILANPDRSNLFKGKIFYLTPGVEPSRKALCELVELSGGQIEKHRRSVKAIQDLNKATQTYIVISCYDDLALIADIFRAKLEFYGVEFIMKAITTQSIDYTSSAYRY